MVIDFSLNTIEQIPVAIAVIGVISYYFGKLISDARPQREVRSVSYIEGISFLIIFILIPSILIYYFNQQISFINYLKPYSLLFILLGYGLTYFLFLKSVYFNTKLLGAESYFKKIYKDKVDEVIDKKLSFAKKYSNANIAYSSMNWFSDVMGDKLSNFTLIFISIFMLLSFAVVILSETNILYITLSSIALFFGLSSLAVLYGYYSSQYPELKIILKDGTLKTGKIVKYDTDFFTIVKGKTKYFINKDEIVSVETPIIIKQVQNKTR
jgi:hypothetical protein